MVRKETILLFDKNEQKKKRPDKVRDRHLRKIEKNNETGTDGARGKI